MKSIAFPVLGPKVQDPTQFVGRNDEMKTLTDGLLSKHFSIVGLPRIGKSSLAYQAVLKVKQSWTNPDIRFLDAWLDISQTSTPKEFFSYIIRKIHELIVQNCSLSQENSALESEYFERALKGRLDNYNIESYFTFVDERIHDKIVLCLDEFDVVRKFLKRSHFGSLHSWLNNAVNIRFLIVTRRALLNIEREICKDANPSTLHQLFENIYLKPFNELESKQYWNRLDPFFKDAKLDISDEHKQAAFSITGNVPYYLDKFNSAYLSQLDEAQKQYEFDIHFNDMVNVLKDQNLLIPAIQTVIGPFYDCTQEQISDLALYGFIRKTTVIEKAKITDSCGYIEENGSVYLCFSDYFTRRLSRYKANAPFWPEWSRLLDNLRWLVEAFLFQNYGEDWINSDLSVVKDIKKSMKQDQVVAIPISNRLVDYVREEQIKTLLMDNWSIFSKIFDCEFHEFEDNMNGILRIRNHHAHINLSAIDNKPILEKTINVCVSLSKAIETWRTNGDENLMMEEPSLCSITVEDSLDCEGTIEKDESGIYHIGSYLVSKNYVETSRMLGKKVRITHSCDNTNITKDRYPKFAKTIIPLEG